MLTNVDPVIFIDAGHFGNGGFAETFKIIVPDSGDGFVVIIPEFAFLFGTVSGDGGIAGVDGVGFAEFVEEIGEADFVENIVLFDIFFKIFLVFNHGVFKGDTIRTN